MKKHMKQLSLSILITALTLLLFIPAVQADDSYKGSVLENEIQEMIDRGVMMQDDDGLYHHTREITREEFTLFLYRALELPDAGAISNLTDLPSDQESVKAISAAHESGIIRGYDDNTFRPDRQIERQQMAAMIDRALDFLEMVDIEPQFQIAAFGDQPEISPRFVYEVAQVASLGIIRGHNNGRFAPEDPAERAHAAAFMNRLLMVIESGAGLSEDGQPVKDEGTFQVASINSNGEISAQSTLYDTFQEAVDQQNQHQLILNDGEIVKMNKGVVRPRHVSNGNINVFGKYKDGSFSNGITYASANHYFSSEFIYLESDDVYTKVRFANTEGYVRTDMVELIPEENAPIEKRNHYTVDANGDLRHYLYNQRLDTSISYTFGIAPEFLETGRKYLSEDGANFHTEDGDYVGTSYQYFNRMNIQSQSDYTAEELDDYIERFAVRPSSEEPTLLLDMGEYFKKYEEKYGINAMYMLAVASHESAFGNSSIAHSRNNLFGTGAFDHDAEGNAIPYETTQDSIEDFAKGYMYNRYTNVENAWVFNGSAPGNKSVGVNVRYASDMFWGQKVTGHMFRIDRALSNKDFGKYDLVETTASGLNVRETPDSRISSNILYNYRKSNMPLIRYGSETAHNGVEWYEVTADHPDHERGLIHSGYIREIPYAK